MNFLFKFFVLLFSIFIIIFIVLRIVVYSEAYEKVNGEGILDKFYDYFYYKTKNRLLKKKFGYKISCDNCAHKYCVFCNRKYFSDWEEKKEVK